MKFFFIKLMYWVLPDFLIPNWAQEYVERQVYDGMTHDEWIREQFRQIHEGGKK